MEMAAPLPAIRWMSYLAVPPARVHRALTTADGWDAWFTRGAALDARPGGAFVLRWRDAASRGHRVSLWGAAHAELEIRAEVIAVEPERRFAFTWTTADHPTTVEFQLAPRGPGTLVSVSESGYTTDDLGIVGAVGQIDQRSPFAMCASGWGEALTLLKFHLEHGLTYGEVPPAG
jgi:uncharacterized protein YndB with AHSA1/START domain